jgi:UDP-N-acetylglucosamine:LPS N-acetylglucosamine transferase
MEMMNIAFVSSKGGHLGQIKIIFTPEVIGDRKAILITEESGKAGVVKEKNFHNRYRTYLFGKDVLGVNPFRYLATMFRLMKIYRKEKIDLVVTNGAQISIPGVIAARLMGIRTLFIDTVVRVKSANWSARASYFFSDIFMVQHANMCKPYGKRAIFRGSIL